MPAVRLPDRFAFDNDAFTGLYHTFLKLVGRGQPGAQPPWPPFPKDVSPKGRANHAKFLAAWIEAGRPSLPVAYRAAFADPLLANLDHVVQTWDTPTEVWRTAEPLANAVGLHGVPATEGVRVRREQVRQLLAVLSNLHRSFLASDKLLAAGLSLARAPLPPLAAFHSRTFADQPPITYPGPTVRLFCGSDVPLIVLPATFADQPLAWVLVAHEGCGHGLLNVDPGLLPDLAAGVRALFGGGPLRPGRAPNRAQRLGLLWSYWAEEAAADVYGLLNVGPTFLFNAAAIMAAARGRKQFEAFPELGFPAPRLGLQLQADPPAGGSADELADLDSHPDDLLRVHLAIGVVESLTGLSAAASRAWARALRQLTDACFPRDDPPPAEGAEAEDGPPRGKGRRKPPRVHVRGRVEHTRDRWVPLDFTLSAAEAFESARLVGAYIATARLPAFGNGTVQDIETWDESDEAIARLIRDKFREGGNGQPRKLGEELAKLGDDGQLLAGATWAALTPPPDRHPDSFAWHDEINRNLAAALSVSFRHDPLLGEGRTRSPFKLTPQLPPGEQEHDHLNQAAATPGGNPPPPPKPSRRGSDKAADSGGAGKAR